MGEPNFGKWMRGIHASPDNPHRDGMFVETIRRRSGRMNSGVYYRLTDGKGRFWEYPRASVIDHPAYPSPPDPRDERIRVLEELLRAAVCPMAAQGCDGEAYPVQVAEDEWAPEQCQWCYERRAALDSGREG